MIYYGFRKFSLCNLWVYSNNDFIFNIAFSKLELIDCKNIETDLIQVAFLELEEYFEGKRQSFDFAINLEASLFRKQVLEAIQTMPYGQTKSYKEIAQMISNKKACRAIGMACNKNPLPIVIPCHRIIGSDGNLTGYAGGLELKKNLLNLEKKSSTQGTN